MRDIAITLNLPEDLVEQARAQGVLNNARIALLLRAEIDRIERWRGLDQSLEPVREAFRADHEGLSEEDILAMVNEAVKEVRATRRQDNNTEQLES
jgi:hypothetical protein